MATMKQMMMMDVLVIHVEMIETICDGDLCVRRIKKNQKFERERQRQRGR